MIGAINTPVVPREYDLFIGLDVDKTSVSVTIVGHEGFVCSLRMPCRAENLIHYVQNHFADKKVIFAYEAGPTGFGLYDQLKAQGYVCLVASPSMIPMAPNERVKTNRLDSKKMAESLRAGQLKSIHVPTIVYRHLRHLVQLRDTLVRQVVASKLRVKSLLLFEGLPFPEVPSGRWTRGVMADLDELPCEVVVRFKLDRLLSTMRFAQEQVLQSTREIRRFCRQDPELGRCIEYVRSIPGIGWITASHLVARLGDWRQLENVRQIGGFIGLTPMEYSTGERVIKGGITRMGDMRLRAKLIQSAWIAITKDAELETFYTRVRQRHSQAAGARKAIVAVARKLTTRVYAVLKEQRMYQPYRRPAAA